MNSNALSSNQKLLNEWDYGKNNHISNPDEVTLGSNRKVWWKCSRCGYEWQASVKSRSRGSNCPICLKELRKNQIITRALLQSGSLEKTHPDLIEEWDSELNAGLKPGDFSPGSHQKIWWKCSVCEHIWCATIKDRTVGQGCPACGRKRQVKKSNAKKMQKSGSLGDKYPLIAAEWDYANNGEITPESISPASDKKVWWKCQKGHQWQATVHNRTGRQSNCPYCSGNKVLIGFNDIKTTRPDLYEEWNFNRNGELKPENYTAGSNKAVWWCCKYGHEWKTTILSRAQGHGCPDCTKRYHSSFPEQAVFFYVQKYFSDSVNGYRNIEHGITEIDVYIPSEKIGIEYDGRAWHSSASSSKKDLKKYLNCKAIGIKLIRIKEQLDSEKDADYCIETQYGLTGKYQDMEEPIKELLELLNVPNPDINVDRDYISILERINTDFLENSLVKTQPELCKDWDYTKNGNLNPAAFTAGSTKKVWWHCKLDHSWQASIGNRTKGQGCPYCSNRRILIGFNDLTTTNPDICREWDFEMNEEDLPENYTAGCAKKKWWKCSSCGFSWQAAIGDRTKGSGCPKCAHNRFRLKS